MTANSESKDMEEAKVASGARTHSRHASTSTVHSLLPTDSMVTVRLSDPPVASITDPCSQTERRNTSSSNVLLEEQRGPNSMYTDNVSDANEDAVVFEEDSPKIETQSKNQMANIAEEGHSIHTSSTIRSRSDTSGSFSSNGSAQVDWDELERSEEQAPRDEGSDEV